MLSFLRVINRCRTPLVAILLLCVMPLIGGCQSPTVTHDQAQSVLQSRIGVRQQLGLTKVQLDAVIAALNEINARQSDGLVDAYTKYSDQLNLLDSSVADLERASAASKAQAQTYFDTAAVKIAAIDDSDLKARATARREKAMGLARTIDDDTRIVELAYRLFLQRFRDIQAYLAADLTSGSVRSIQDQFSLTNLDVAPLKAKSDQLSYDLELADELMNTGEVKPATTSVTTLPTTTP